MNAENLPSQSDFTDTMLDYTLFYVYFGIGTWICAWIQTTFLMAQSRVAQITGFSSMVAPWTIGHRGVGEVLNHIFVSVNICYPQHCWANTIHPGVQSVQKASMKISD